MEKPMEKAWVGMQVGWEGSQGITWGEAKSVNQIYGDLGMAPTCSLFVCGGGRVDQKRNNGLCQYFCLGEGISGLLFPALEPWAGDSGVGL